MFVEVVVTKRNGFAGPMALLLVWQLAACKASEEATQDQKPTVSTVSAPSWEAGKRYLYATDLKSKLSAAGRPLTGFVMSAALALETRQAGAETEYLAGLFDIKLTAEKPENQEQFAALARELSAPFGFSTVDGKLSSVMLRPEWSAFAASIARTLAAGLQFVERQADQPAANVWTASETDATGTYTAEYTATGPTGPLSKRKLRYENIPLGKLGIAQLSGGVKPEVLESKGSLLLGDAPGRPRIARVEYGEKLKLQVSPTSLVHSETELVLAFKPNEQRASTLDWTTALAGAKRQAPNEAKTSRGTTADYDAQRIGDYTFDKAVSELEQQMRDTKGGQDLIEAVRGKPLDPTEQDERKSKFAAQGRVFSALAALMRADPQNIKKAVSRVRGGSSAQRALLDALSSAGSPQAQGALVSLMNDAKSKPGLQSAAAFSLTRTDNATAATVTALQGHIGANDALRVHALFGLGTIARHLREAGEIARADAIVSTLVQALGQAASPTHKVEVLRGIANSGNAIAFSAVKPLLGDRTPKVHAAAIEAMRLMAHPEVDAILAQAATQPNQTVQGAALDAISVREPSPALQSALETASGATFTTSVRVKAVRIMGHWLPKRPELRKTLEQVAQTDAEAVKKAAQTALGA